MYNYLEDPTTRLKNWREFREVLTQVPTEKNMLEGVINYWKNAPISLYNLDAENCNTWPTPWEIINEGNFCSTTLAYIMEQTLHLSDPEVWTPDRFKLKKVKDINNEYLYMALVIDNKYVLNHPERKLMTTKVLEGTLIMFSYQMINEGHISI